MADPRQIVVVTARAELRAAVLRLAALAGAEAEVVSGSSGVRAVWRAAHIVVVGSDLAGALAAAGLPRRPGVVLIAIEEPDLSLWRSAVALGAAHVLSLPADEQDLVELVGAAVEQQSAGGSVVAVIGGCGGAGASTFAAALAMTSARGAPTLLVDADRRGGGLDVLLGAEQAAGARWPELAATRGRLSATSLAEALVHVEGLGLLSWDRAASTVLSAEAAGAVMDAAIRGHRLVVVDLPRHLDETALLLASAADLIVVVVPATVRAVAAAATVVAEVHHQCGSIRLVVRDARVGHLEATEIAAALGLPMAAKIQSEAAVAAAAERGEPPIRRSRGSLFDACRALLNAASAPAAA